MAAGKGRYSAAGLIVANLATWAAIPCNWCFRHPWHVLVVRVVLEFGNLCFPNINMNIERSIALFALERLEILLILS